MEHYIGNVMGLEKVPFYLREAVCEEMSHGVEVSNLAVLIAKELGESEEFCSRIELAGILHDIGKLKYPLYFFPFLFVQTLGEERLKYHPPISVPTAQSAVLKIQYHAPSLAYIT